MLIWFVILFRYTAFVTNVNEYLQMHLSWDAYHQLKHPHNLLCPRFKIPQSTVRCWKVLQLHSVALLHTFVEALHSHIMARFQSPEISTFISKTRHDGRAPLQSLLPAMYVVRNISILEKKIIRPENQRRGHTSPKSPLWSDVHHRQHQTQIPSAEKVDVTCK